MVAQNVSINTDEVGTDSGSDLSQIDWRTEQTVDSTLNRVRQIFISGNKPTKRQIALESKDAQSFLRQWDSLFLKDDVLYRRRNFNGTTVNQLVLPEIYRDRARSLRNCVPLPISISHGPRRTILWAVECLNALIRRCLICWELWRTIKVGLEV